MQCLVNPKANYFAMRFVLEDVQERHNLALVPRYTDLTVYSTEGLVVEKNPFENVDVRQLELIKVPLE